MITSSKVPCKQETSTCFSPRLTLTCLIFLLLPFYGFAQIPNEPADLLKSVDGEVKAMALDSTNDILYIGGNFSVYDYYRTSGGVLAMDDFKLNRDFPEIIGGVRAIVPDGANGWYVTGDYLYNVDGIARDNFVHLLNDGTVGPWQMTFASSAQRFHDMELVGNELVVAGNFSSINGTARDLIACFDVTTQTLTTWTPDVDGLIRTLSSKGDTLYIGGSFNTVDGNSRGGAAAYDMTTKTLLPWDPRTDGSVWAIETYKDTVFVGGSFLNVQSNIRQNLCMVDDANGDLLAWNIWANDIVHDIHIVDEYAYVGGEFNNLVGHFTPNVGRLNLAQDTADHAWKAALDGDVYCIDRIGDEIFVAGEFNEAEGKIRDRFAVYSHATGELTDREIGCGHSGDLILDIASNGDDLFIGGDFESLGGDIRHKIAGIDLYTGKVTDFDPIMGHWHTSKFVEDIELNSAGDTIYIAGEATQVDYVYEGFALGMEVSTQNIFWKPDVNSGGAAWVYDIELVDSLIIFGGNFDDVEGQPVSNLVGFGKRSKQQVWTPDCPGGVYHLNKVGDSAIIVGGIFNSFDGQVRQDLAMIDRATLTLNSWDADLTGLAVRSSRFTDSSYFIGGNITAYQGTSRYGVFEVIHDTKALTPFNPTSGSAYDICAVNDSILVYGHTGMAAGKFKAFNYVTNSFLPWLNAWNGSEGNETEYYRGILMVGGDINKEFATAGWHEGLANYDISCENLNISTLVDTVIAGAGAGYDVEINAPITGSFPIVCQWEVSTDGGAIFNPVVDDSIHSGSDGAVLTISAGAGEHLNIYRLVIVNGCSNATSSTTVLNYCGSLTNLTENVCASYETPSSSDTLYTSGIFYDTLINAAGCDSILAIDLTINNSYASLSMQSCGPEVMPSGAPLSATGIYLDTIPNTYGCDSVITVDFDMISIDTSVVQSVDTLFSFQVGAQYNWYDCSDLSLANSSFDPSFVVTSSGDYFVEVTYNGCVDSSACHNICLPSTFSFNDQNCGTSYLSPSTNHTWISSGVYQDTLVNSAGCDSLLTISLLLGPTFDTVQELSCDSVGTPSGNFTIYSSGVYSDTISNFYGCDSVIQLEVTIMDPDTSFNAISCDSLISPSGSFVWNSSGVYLDTLTSSFGCDSILTVTLDINTSYSEALFDTIPLGDSVFIGGAWQLNSGVYTDTMLSISGCDSIVITDLTVLIGVGLDQITGPTTMWVGPNPANESVIVHIEEVRGDEQLLLVNSLGQRVLAIEKGNLRMEQTLNLANLNSGQYICLLIRNGLVLQSRKISVAR